MLGSTVTGWLGTLQHRGVDFSFWLGNQGLEFTSMGRVWQILLFVGLLFWVFLLGRALWPALKKPSETRGLIAMVFLSATCIGGFYATSLTWGQHTHYSMIEYWRWWLVHLWVEGFFEVFATAVVALIFTNLGLIRAASANRAIIAETIVFLFGGILGTLHHLYWTGTPTSVIAVGSVFSALEVVPLTLIGLEALQTYRRSKAVPWLGAYKWVILSFVAVGFWNTVGAGLLGFAINPPASLYYVQGLNMTAAHGHAALFGVYGMLGIGLMLFCLRGLYDRALHADRFLKPAFWSLNIGLAMMVFLSLLPAGIYQAWASITKGLWYARSPEIIHSPVMETLVWLRVPGDIVFAAGSVLLAVYALKLLRTGRRSAAATAGRDALAGRALNRQLEGVSPSFLPWTTMKLTAFTDYSLRVLIYLATDTTRRATIAEIAEVVRHLGEPPRQGRPLPRQAGLDRDRPRQGRRHPAGDAARQVNVGKVVRDTEGAAMPAECFSEDGDRCVIDGSCRLKGVLGEAVRAFYAVLDRYTLADITRNRQALGKVLMIRAA